MSGSKTFYITTAISYVNGPPHLGHAYEAIATDVLARFKRLDGYDVMFLTGTDEHGQKVARIAEAAGKDPRTYCDETSDLFREMDDLLNISNDDFIRTTEPRHYKSSKALWKKLEDAGEIYLGHYDGWYSVRDEAYFGEDELTKGEGGKFFAPGGAEVEWVEEPSYFFRLSKWQDRLLKHYEDNPTFIQPDTRRTEGTSFVKSGLNDLSVSRTSFDWGIPVPDVPGHIMYVWLDALTNYITGVGHPDVESDSFAKYWPADIHVIGKDIVRFHAVYWPAFLMAAGIEPPKQVFGHGFINIEGEKMSKSLGNVLSPAGLVGEYGLDQIRYFLMREVPFGRDGSFSHESIVQRVNADLANDFGNLAQRVLSMINKNCHGKLPEPGAFSLEDNDLLNTHLPELVVAMRDSIERREIHNALGHLWSVISEANRYVDAEAPWALRKTDPARMATVLYVLAEVIRWMAVLARPVVPDAAGRVLDQLAIADDEAARNIAALEAGERLAPGTPLPKPEGVFPRYVEPESSGAGAR
jgi:methionyl-tRNA synthetase